MWQATSDTKIYPGNRNPWQDFYNRHNFFSMGELEDEQK
jgi:hypothetical protein